MGGKAYCVVHKQALFTIDINGQMDEQVWMSNKSGQTTTLTSRTRGSCRSPADLEIPTTRAPPSTP